MLELELIWLDECNGDGYAKYDYELTVGLT